MALAELAGLRFDRGEVEALLPLPLPQAVVVIGVRAAFLAGVQALGGPVRNAGGTGGEAALEGPAGITASMRLLK